MAGTLRSKDMNSTMQSRNSHGSGTRFASNNDGLLVKLKEQEKIKELNMNDGAKYTIEADDDGGQIQ